MPERPSSATRFGSGDVTVELPPPVRPHGHRDRTDAERGSSGGDVTLEPPIPFRTSTGDGGGLGLN